MTGRLYLTVAEVLTIHHILIELYGGIHGVCDQALLESAIFRPQTGYYNDLAEEAAALLESLINNHAFHDGNKRIALAAADIFLDSNGYYLDLEPVTAYAFITESLAKTEFRFPLILEWIRQHLKPLPLP